MAPEICSESSGCGAAFDLKIANRHASLPSRADLVRSVPYPHTAWALRIPRYPTAGGAAPQPRARGGPACDDGVHAR